MRDKIILIGTGAISNLLYLPLLSRTPDWRRRTLCYDRNETLLAKATGQFGLTAGRGDLQEALKSACLAIIATPPKSHHSLARMCLEAGAHVLVEKPLTDTYEEAVDLVTLAEQLGLLLMVNHTRRLFPCYKEIKRLLSERGSDLPLELEYSEGGPFAWPTASGFYFDASAGGKGVLSDRGSHVIDLLCWWMNGRPEVTSCLTDGDGGVEGFCDVRLAWPSATARMRLSWHNKMQNMLTIRSGEFVIKSGIYDYQSITVTSQGRERVCALQTKERTFDDFAFLLGASAVKAALGDGPPPVQAKEVMDSMAALDDCYSQPRRVDLPWLFKYSPTV